jgi:hypothetical protein
MKGKKSPVYRYQLFSLKNIPGSSEEIDFDINILQGRNIDEQYSRSKKYEQKSSIRK